MNCADFSFEGIEGVEKSVHDLADQIAYVAIWDRTDRRVEEPVGRFDFDPDRALPWLEGVEPQGDDGEDEGPPQEADHDGDGGPLGSEVSQVAGGPPEGASRHLGTPELLRACCRWLRSIATRNTVGWPYRRFRVRLCGPKGLNTLDSGSFLCRNDGYEEESEEAAVQDLRIPAPSFEQIGARATFRPMQSLGDYYAQWGNIVLGSVGQLQGVNNVMLNRLHRQLSECRDQVDQLVAAILEFRFRDAVARDQAEAEHREGDVRATLARDALNQIGEAARAFLLVRGVNPEIAEMVAAMGASPDLVSALNDPEVKGLMRNPENLKILAAMLRGAAAQARAARLVSEQAPAEPANGARPIPRRHPPRPDPQAAPPAWRERGLAPGVHPDVVRPLPDPPWRTRPCPASRRSRAVRRAPPGRVGRRRGGSPEVSRELGLAGERPAMRRVHDRRGGRPAHGPSPTRGSTVPACEAAPRPVATRRHRRRQPAHAGRAARPPPVRSHGPARVDHRRDRHGQGAVRPRAPPPEPAGGEALRRRELPELAGAAR